MGRISQNRQGGNLKTATHLPDVFTEELAGKSWKTFVVLRQSLKVGLIAQPTRQRGFYQGWKAWRLGWDNVTIEGSCKTFFGKLAKRDAIAHASQGKSI